MGGFFLLSTADNDMIEATLNAFGLCLTGVCAMIELGREQEAITKSLAPHDLGLFHAVNMSIFYPEEDL